MPLSVSPQNFWLSLSLLLLAGCAQLNSGWNGYGGGYYDSYAQSDADELLDFGANMARIAPSARAKICRTLLKRQRNSAGTGLDLHLMVGRLLSDACGDIPRILKGVNAIPPGRMYDERIQKLVAIHTEALKRLQAASRKTGSLERKQKSEPESSDESRLLREKLEAIRSMEKHLDESDNAN